MSDSGSGDDADVASSSRPQRNVFDMLGDSDAEHSDEAPRDEPQQAAPAPAATRRAPRAAAKPSANDDIDALLADLNAHEPAAVKTGKNKKKQKGKKAAGAEPAPAADAAPKKPADDDIEAILAGLEISDAPAKSKKKQKGKKDAGAPVTAAGPSPVADTPQQEATSAGGAAPNELDDLLAQLAEPAEPAAADEPKKKKKPKKKKEKEEGAVAAAPAPSKAAKPSAMIQRLKEQLEAQKRAEEEFKRQEEERLRRIEEERRLEEEEERRREEERLRRVEEKKKKQEELRRQGKLLSKTQKAKAEKNQAFLEQMRAQGVLPPAEAARKPRPIVRRKGKKPAPKAGAAAEEQKEEDRAPEPAPQEEPAAAPEPTPAVEPEPQAPPAAEVVEPEALEPEQEEKGDDEDEALSEPSPASSSESVLDAWDMDSEEEREARREKEARKAARQKARLQRHRERLYRRQQRQREKEAAEQARLAAEKTSGARTPAKTSSPAKADAVPAAAAAVDTNGTPATSDEDHDGDDADAAQARQESRDRREQRRQRALAERSASNLRSPICCILGHVDTGKTKILDKIRQTKVQDGEAGGITQQIGASYFPMESIKAKTAELNSLQKKQLEYRLPGLLIIDTPGHESFTNLRSRGSSLCDIAILVVDIMHGLEQQTLESLRLLRSRKTPFIVALNKIDRIYGWKARPWAPLHTTLAEQDDHAKREFDERVTSTMVAFAEQGLNCALYYKNTDFRKNVSLVPTSAITGEGLPDLLMLLVQLTQSMMSERLQYISDLQCTVLEVKVVDGIGTTIDVILSNGYLHVNDTIVVCGLSGPIVTTIRALLTPFPMTELRVKGEYQRLKSVKAAAGIKIAASGLEDAVAGSQLLVCGPGDDIDDLKDEVMTDLASILSKVDKSGKGVCVQASTLGSLEALLQFLADMKIPVSGIAIGPVHKKDVMRASVMLERQREYAVILAFDVKVSAEARQFAADHGVRVFTADIIYHLFDQFTAYMKEVESENQAQAESTVVFPVVLEVMKEHIFRMKDPIVIGVHVKEGILRKGTPLVCFEKGNIPIGEVTGLELNNKEVNEARAGQQVCIKIEPRPGQAPVTYGRQFDHTVTLQSRLSRPAIDVLKTNFKDYLSQDDWKCVIKLKKMQDII